MAFSRFCNWDRSVRDTPVMPVGLWMTRTAVATLFTLCPPGPLARNIWVSTSTPSIVMFSASPGSGMTSTDAMLVCRRPALSKGDMRTSRCTPCSPARVAWARGPPMSIVMDLIPSPSPWDVSKVSTGLPSWAAQAAYMAVSIRAQSWASAPPAPARTVTRAGRSSFSLASRSARA